MSLLMCPERVMVVLTSSAGKKRGRAEQHADTDTTQRIMEKHFTHLS